jgi:membrane protein DedA with SNARE-associated domain
MPSRIYVPLTLLGLTLRMFLVVGLGEWLREPIEALLALIDEHRVLGTAVLVTGVAVYKWRRRPRGRI